MVHLASEEEIAGLLLRFEQYKRQGEGFFSEDDIEHLKEHFIEQSLYEEALFILRYAMETYPFSSGFKIDKAEALLMYGQEEKALKVIEEIEFVEPYNTEALFMKASILSQLGKHAEAIRCLKRCLTYHYEDIVDIYFHIGLEYQFLEDYDQARQYFVKVLGIDAKHQEALFELSVSYDVSGKLEEGIAYFESFIDQHPYHANAWFHMGYLLTRLSLPHKALHAFDYASLIDEKYLPAKINKANTLCILDRHQEALDLYFEITQIQKPDSYLLYLIGETYENLGKYEESLNYYKQSTTLDNLNADAWLGIAVIKDTLGETKEALLYTKKALDIEPLNAMYWFVQAEFLRKTEQIAESKLSFDQSVELDPYQKETWLDYSAMLFENNQKDEAIEMLHEAIFFLPNEADLYYRLTAYYIGNGLSEDASEALSDAIRLNKDGYLQLIEEMPHLKESKFMRDLLSMHRIHLS